LDPGPLIIASTGDPASQNIATNLIENHNFLPETPAAVGHASYVSGDVRLLVQGKECIYVEPTDVNIPARFVIFASKHRSSSGRPALTVHATGNLTKESEYGGRREEISIVEAYRVKQALAILAGEVEDSSLKIEVAMEATHHGPTSFSVPVCFVEVGSGPGEWSDRALGLIAANAIMGAAKTTSGGGINAVGFGGPHYSPKHTRLNINGDYAIGHLVAKYAFDRGVSEDMVRETFHKTVGGCSTAVIDWKGIKGEDRRNLVERLQKWDVEVVRI